jgi:hypothetical protein
MDGTIVHMKVECSKDQLPLLGGRQDEKYAGKIERHQDSKRSSERQQSNQSTRQRAQPSTRQQNRQSTRQQNRQSTRQRTQPPQDSRTGSQQENGHSPPQESRITEKCHRLQDQEINKRKGSPKKNQTRVSRGRQARPTHLQRYKLTVKQDNQLGKLEG